MNKSEYVIHLSESMKEKIQAYKEKAQQELQRKQDQVKNMTPAERRQELAKLGIVGAGAMGTHSTLKGAHGRAKESGGKAAAKRKLGF